MIASLIGVYAVLPSSMVQYWLLQREYRMGVVAGVNAAQVGTDNLLTAALAVFGFGAWAIVLPKVLTAPIWLIGMRRAVKWRFSRRVPNEPFLATIRFCLPILASEMLVAVRNNADNMLVGTILGLEALGIYYFAYNAGYGLSSVLTKALAAVSFPHLADPKLAVERLVERFDHALYRLVLPIGLIIIVQAAFVPIYVPILFGDKWSSEIVIVGVLCLSAATSACYDLAAQLLRAGGMQGPEFRASALFTFMLLVSFAIALPFGLLPGVIVLCAGTVSMQAGFAFWARWRIRNHLAELRLVPVPSDLPGSKNTNTGGLGN
jgi:PST family polysaccharide transporter